MTFRALGPPLRLLGQSDTTTCAIFSCSTQSTALDMTTSQLLDPAQIAPGCSGRDVESDPSPSSSSCTIAFSAEVSPCRRPQVYRSKRRRASEDLLHRLHAAPPQQPPPAKRHRPMQSWVQVAKCGDACPCQMCGYSVLLWAVVYRWHSNLYRCLQMHGCWRTLRTWLVRTGHCDSAH